MFVHQFARFAVIVGILVVANGCSHCGHHKHGVVDCLVGGGCDDCNTGCDTGCGHGHRKCRNTPQFGGDTYQDCGCGELYHGDWKSHPPCADPCDCHGNHIGCANGCQDCGYLNRGRHCGLKGVVKSIFHGCDLCDEGCDSCTSGPSGGCATGNCATKGCTTCGH